jgi:hypothetical protein
MLLSEMLGVEREVDFGVKGYAVTFKISTFLEEYEYLMYRWSPALDWREAEGSLLCSIIAKAPNNIIHLPPPLTDEQREQLRALYALGGRWIARDGNGNVFAYDSKPQKVMICCHWNNEKNGECFTVIRDLSVCSLVSWSDLEPYDIGKALGIKN